LDLQGSLFVLLQEGINVKSSGEVKGIINLFQILSNFVIDDSIYLEKQSFRRLLDPTMLFNPNNFSLIIAIVVNVGNCDFFTCLIKLSVFDVDHKQTKQLIFSFVDLDK